MKNKSIIMAAAVAALVSFASSVQALPFINGTIGFTGSYLPDNANLTLANQISFGPLSTSVQAGSQAGDFASIPNGATVTMFSPLAVNPAPPSQLALWAVGGFTFDALSLVQSATTPNSLTLTGSGVIKSAGFEDTTGLWIATFNTISGAAFTWSSSAGSTRVPDGGTTVMLLGAALSGLCLLRKKMTA